MKPKSTAKDRPTAKTVNEYFATVPQSARSKLQELRKAIRSAVPVESTETISYGIPCFKLNGCLVWFAGFANHCSLFPTSSVIAAFKKELKNFHTSKGTIQFPLDKPLPVALVKRLVKARVAQARTTKRHEN
jgi:uncharacterized protein YdhG (YjbR/CyaY superfamily)